MIPLDEIRNYLLSTYPEEGCGVLISNKSKIFWKPCDNVALDRMTGFYLDPHQYSKALFQGKLVAVVHSHPNSSSTLSAIDKENARLIGVPYLVISIPNTSDISIFYPEKFWEDLLGKEYSFGTNDCLQTAISFYEKFGIKLKERDTYIDDWWLKGIDYFTDTYIEQWGFSKVANLSIGSFITFSVNSDIPNHCGVYLGDNYFLHHSESRLSCREPIARWYKYITGIYNYA